MDVNVSNKILISFSKLQDRAKILAEAYDIKVIEASDQHDDDDYHLTKVVDTITQLYNNTKNRDASL
jgi:hypothetical protein